MGLQPSRRSRPTGKTGRGRASGADLVPSGVAGVDEAGRGAVIGPLVVACVRSGREDAIRDLGVKDSKALSPRRREELDRQIRRAATVEVVALSAAEVDARGERGLNSLEAQTFGKLIGSVRPGRAYVDAADVDAGRFRDAVGAVAGAGIELVSEHKADAKYPLVSAASIVAKVRRDAEVRAIAAGLEERLGPGPLSRVGSGYPGDRRTRDCILTWIKERGIPPPHTRLSWDTVRRLTAEAKVRQLSEW